MMDYAQYMGYSPFAPQLGYASGGGPEVESGNAAPPVAMPAQFSASGSFAVAGWLAAFIVGLAAYRYLWEKAG